MKNIVITGGTGQLGRRLVARLSRGGVSHIHCIGRDPLRSFNLLRDHHNVQHIDAIDAVACDAVLRDADVLIHGAFARSDDGRALAQSLDFSRGLFERACMLGVATIVNISSQSVYGTSRTAPATEQDAIDPVDRYAIAKYASELLLESIAMGTSTRIAQIRLASLIGEGMEERLVTKFVVQALAQQPLRIQGGSQRFSFLDIEDAATGLARMLEVPSGSWRTTYNLGPARSHSLLEIAQAVADAVRSRTGASVAIERAAQDSSQDSTLDTSAFQQDFGFVPEIDLKATIDSIIERHTLRKE